MRNPKQLTSIAKGLNCRFFVAIEYLITAKRLKSLSVFCIKFNLSDSRYREMRATYGVIHNPKAKVSRYKSIEVEALYHLCDFYSISTEWLLLGRGEMFKNETVDKV
jgi:hypothetical protein